MAGVSKQKTFNTIVTDSSAGSVMRMSVEEYKEWSASQGRIMGRKPDQKTYPSVEEMRILINSGWSRAMVKEKHGIDDKEIDKILVEMSNKERRDKVVVLH